MADTTADVSPAGQPMLMAIVAGIVTMIIVFFFLNSNKSSEKKEETPKVIAKEKITSKELKKLEKVVKEKIVGAEAEKIKPETEGDYPKEFAKYDLVSSKFWSTFKPRIYEGEKFIFEVSFYENI